MEGAASLRWRREVTAVVAIPPLQAALTNQVDGHTLLDLFETEEWWRPVRDEFKGLRLISGGELMAAQGKLDLGSADRELVAAARKNGVTSSLVVVNGVPLSSRPRGFPWRRVRPRCWCSPTLSTSPRCRRWRTAPGRA